MRNLSARAARWSAAHWKTAVFAWIVLVAVLVALPSLVASKQVTSADITSGDSRVAEQILLTAGFPEYTGESVLIQHPSKRATDPDFQAVVGDVAGTLGRLANVQNVQAPTGPEGRALVSQDGHAALVQFQMPGTSEDAKQKVPPILEQVAAVQRGHPGYTIAELGGASASHELEETLAQDFKRAEQLTIPVTLLILVVAFGALVAASIPVVLAFTAVLATLGLVALLSPLVPTAGQPTQVVVLLIGMAVGVDYCLFYLRREREEVAAGRDRSSALRVAAATSGQAVLISGATVLVAVAGLLLAGDGVLSSIAVGSMLVVLVAMIGSLTVLPALLAKLGHRVDKGRIPLLGRVLERRRQRGGGAWARVVGAVLRRPLLSAMSAGLVLAVLAVPALSLQTKTLSVTEVLPKDLPIIKTYDRIQAAFPGAQVPATVVVKAADVTSPPMQAAIDALHRRAIASGQMSEPVQVDINPTRTVATVSVPVKGTGNDEQSVAALRTLRTEVLPATVGKVAGATAAVTGSTALNQDFSDLIRTRAPLVFAFVLGVAFLLLLVTFRSIVIPLKAIALNLLGVAASYGILVAVFQHGWGASLLGVEPNGAIMSWLPLFLFVVLFGLSMDYHVFILSRVKELVDGGQRTHDAVAGAIKATAGTVTSAAIVMVAVFAIFATLRTVDMKQLGIGLAVAVLLDATIIRAVLLPATMALLGDWNWYLPRWLHWLPALSHGAEISAPVATEPVPRPAKV
jgi:RND superfamily putative drug exporter